MASLNLLSLSLELLKSSLFLPFLLKKLAHVDEFCRQLHLALDMGQMFVCFKFSHLLTVCTYNQILQISPPRPGLLPFSTSGNTTDTSGNTSSVDQKSPKNLFWRHSTHGKEKIWPFDKFLQTFLLP